MRDKFTVAVPGGGGYDDTGVDAVTLDLVREMVAELSPAHADDLFARPPAEGGLLAWEVYGRTR